MTELNTFCYSESCGGENGFQQKPYRLFNFQLEKENYSHQLKKVTKILDGLKLELKTNPWSFEWKKVTDKQWGQLFALAVEVRGDNFKEGFEYITGLDLSNIREGTTTELTLQEIADKFGVDVNNLRIKE